MRREYAKEEDILPTGYERLEYIENVGNSYIRTGVIPDLNIEWYLDFQPISKVNGSNGSILSYTNPMFLLAIDFNPSKFNLAIGEYPNQWTEEFTPVDTNRHTVVIKNGLIKYDNTVRTHALISSCTSPGEVFLFARNDNGRPNFYAKERIFRCTFTGLRDFIPALRMSDNKPGLYDILNNQFYTNSGAGEFLY